ncbi:MAG: NIPSNAP family protein [Candidatus Acidiferrales bacterium]
MLIELFDREFVEPQEAVGMQVIGQFRDIDEADNFVWLRGFADMARRADALEEFYSGPVWARHRDCANGTMVNSDNVLLLRPVGPEGAFSLPAAPRPGPGTPGSGRGIIVSTICHLAPNTEADFAELYARAVRPLLAETKAKVLAALVSERSANTFSRLPVREGETVFVWFSGFPSLHAYETHLAALAGLETWTRSVLPQMDERAWCRNVVSRLVPTARSRLHG